MTKANQVLDNHYWQITTLCLSDIQLQAFLYTQFPDISQETRGQKIRTVVWKNRDRLQLHSEVTPANQYI